MPGQIVTWGITAVATAGVILRPLNIPEGAWALGGAAVLVAFGLLPLNLAWAGVGKGVDVYLFLCGMMVLAELARREGLFDWLAAQAVRLARGSPTRLFGLVYAVGVLVTVFLSNDATAVVLTPAVAAVARAAQVRNPLPYLLICAFVANAASFVLPISNPANLVIFAGHMPTLTDWIGRFGVPAMLSVAATFLVLRWNQRGALNQVLESKVTVPTLSSAGKLAAGGIGVTAIALMMASAFGLPLGWPTCAAAFVALSLVTAMTRGSPWRYLREVSWGVIPLVAGLFIFVEALHYTGVIQALSEQLGKQIQHSTGWAAVAAGLLVAFGSNLINNLPAGLIAGTVLQSANAASVVSSAALIGVDVGPNLSVTGSLATILWLTALRRDGVQIRSWDFLRVGLWVMPPALILPLAALVTMA